MKMTKSKIYKLIAAVLIIVILAVAFWFYLDNKNKNNVDEKELNRYRKALYDAKLCQYNCNTYEKVILNKTEIVIDSNCMGGCITNFSSQQFSKEIVNRNYTDDEMFLAFEKVFIDCKKTSLVGNKINQSLYMGCVASTLEAMKKDFVYLN